MSLTQIAVLVLAVTLAFLAEAAISSTAVLFLAILAGALVLIDVVLSNR